MTRVLSCFLLVALAGAGELRAPIVIFRTPDRATRKEIRKLVPNGFEVANKETRAATRQALVDIGPWTVPFLVDAFKRSPLAAQNAAITITLIGDRAGLPALRAAVSKSNEWVGRTSCLAVGHFGLADDAELLHRRLTDPRCRYRAGAALALGRLPGGGAILSHEDLPRDPHVAAALVLATAIASADADCKPHLRHKSALVRRAAATALLIRPLNATEADVLIDALKRPDAPKDRPARARMLQALALVPGRTPEIRARLLKSALKEKGREPRIAALLGLATEWNIQDQFKPLRTMLKLSDKDPLVGPLFLALVRTGHPKAVDLLLDELRGEGNRPFYAAGCLVHAVLATRDGKRHPREDEILKAVGRAHTPLRQLAQALLGVPGARQREIAAERFEKIGDPHGQDLWHVTPAERAWIEVNRLLPFLFELDDLADAGDPSKRAQGPAIGIGNGDDGEGKKGPTQGKPAEQDLLWFLSWRPYFGPEHLRGR